MPQTGSGRFLFMFVLMGGVLIVGVVLRLVEAINEPVGLGGLAL